MEETHHDSDKAPSGLGWGSTPRRSVLKGALLVLLVLVNLAAVYVAVLSIRMNGEDRRCPTKDKAREVVAPLCVPCEEGWSTGQGTGTEEQEEEEGWRRYTDNQGDLCCPLHHHNLAVAMDQIYHTVLQEQQQDFDNFPQGANPLFSAVYGAPESTGDTVLFANNNKPSAHITGVQPYDASKYFNAEANSGMNDSLQTVSDWPLRFEPYRSTARGYVQRLTWGLVVPVSGLYRVHSTVNLYFTYSQNTKDLLQQRQLSQSVVHQVTRYSRSEGLSTVLTQRNHTTSRVYVGGMTSFLVTVHWLEVGDVVSVSLSHRAAMALRDRWHSQGLFLLQ